MYGEAEDGLAAILTGLYARLAEIPALYEVNALLDSGLATAELLLLYAAGLAGE
jgi:hypothetical protein